LLFENSNFIQENYFERKSLTRCWALGYWRQPSKLRALTSRHKQSDFSEIGLVDTGKRPRLQARAIPTWDKLLVYQYIYNCIELEGDWKLGTRILNNRNQRSFSQIGTKTHGQFTYFIQISYKRYKLGNFISFALFWGRMRPKTVVPRMPSVFQSYFECGGDSGESVCVWLSVSVLFRVWVWLPLMSVTVPYLVYPPKGVREMKKTDPGSNFFLRTLLADLATYVIRHASI